MQYKIFLSVILITIFGYHSNSQSLAINTDGSTANASALLDVKSTAKGMLIPRMSRTERNGIASPATGLLIFQNAPDSIGFHYYDGTKWTWLFSNSNADSLAWKTGGNAGTIDGTHFIGTTDNIPLTIKVNNQLAGRIDQIKENTFWGYQSGISNTAGQQNTAVGNFALKNNTTGNFNSALGDQALFSNTTGGTNTASGYKALYSNSTGGQNTANGVNALFSNTTGGSNTANGFHTLYYNTTGGQNTANGVQVLQFNTTGGQNTANGHQSLFNNTTGNGNTANGVFTLYNNSTGSSNTANGVSALILNTTGSGNTANGVDALFNNTTGNDNTAIGRNTLYYNTTGTNNTANGVSALQGNTTGTNNTANGVQALQFNTTGSNNIANGINALQNNTTGNNNTANGAEALQYNSTGYSNIAEGSQSLYANTVGYQNIAIGKTSMYSNISGVNNTAVGVQSLYLNTTGIDNTAYGPNSLFYNNGDGNSAYGWSSLFNNATGNYNTAVGYYASGLNTTGYSNVAVGAKALYSNTVANNLVAVGDSSLYNSTGAGNTAIGSKAGYNLTTGTNNVFLGYQAGYNVTTGSDKLYVANNSTGPPIIYGDFSNKTLGLGTITPNSTYGYAKVEIASEGYLAPADLLIRNAVNDAGYAPGLVFQHARGTLATPLTVNNGDYLSAISTMNYDGSNYILSAGLDIYADGAIAAGIVPTKLQFNTMNTVGNYATRLTIKNDGKTGIGTTTPSAKLHIGGGTRFTVLDTGAIFLQSGNTIGSARDWKIAVTLPNGYLSFRDMGFDNTGTGAMATDAMVIAWGTGNVGIGTPTPNSTLQVDGTIAIGTSLNIAGGPGGTPVSLLNQKSYVGVLPANGTNNYYQLPDPTVYPGRTYIIRNNSSVDAANITTAAGLLFPGNSNVGGATYTLNPTGTPKTVMAISDGANWTIMVQN